MILQRFFRRAIADTTGKSEAYIETTVETSTEAFVETPSLLATETVVEAVSEPPSVINTLSVTNLLTLSEYSYDVGNEPQQLHYNFTNNTLFCRNGRDELCLIDFSADTYSTHKITSDWIAVNPHNGHMYLYTVGYEDTLVDITNGTELIMSYNLYTYPVFFTSSTELVSRSMKISVETGEELISGYLPGFSETYDSYPEPFLCNNDYYYYYQGSYSYPSAIVKSTQILTSDRSHTLAKELTNYKDIIAHHVSTDSVYYMTTDHSIYRVNLEGDDSLLIDGSCIQNTGSAYLSSNITELVRISDNCFVVFDNLDKAVKLVGELPS